MSEDIALRADEAMVLRGLAPSRSQARLLIREGRVRREGDREPLDKPSRTVSQHCKLHLVEPPRFVSRAGDKLAALLQQFNPPVEGKLALDLGASTGGFTDCLLQQGARHVTAIDVGHGQLVPALQNNPAVLSIEGYNARHLKAGDLPHRQYDMITADLSFISITHILPAAWPLLSPDGWAGILVKPQFELDPSTIKRCKGVVRDPALQQQALQSVLDWVRQHLSDAIVKGWLPSPIVGGDGNHEFLLCLVRGNGIGPA